MNVLIADNRISLAPLIAAELRARNVSVTLAAPEKNASSKPEHKGQKEGTSRLNEVFWNPLSWLSSNSLLFESTIPAGLDALVLLFDLKDLASGFAEIPPSGIFESSVIAIQNLLDGAIKKFHKQKSGRIVFVLNSGNTEQFEPLHLSGIQHIAAGAAEAAFIRTAEETASMFSKLEGSALDAVLIKSPFETSWVADCIVDAKSGKNSGKWLSQSGRFSSIFQRKI